MQTQADFDISPADILAVQQLLQTQTSLLFTPEGRDELQYLLAPILCKNSNQQAEFYRIYQIYLAKDLQSDNHSPTSKKSIEKSNSFRWWYLLIGLIGLLLLISKFGFKQDISTAKIQFERPKNQIHIGDTLRIKNTSVVDASIPVVYEWTYLNKKNKQVEHQQKGVDFNFSIPETGRDYLKTLRLTGRNSETEKILGVDSITLPIYCKNPPIIHEIIIEDTLLTAGSPLPFSAEVTQNNLAFSWKFGDGDTSSFVAPIHTYEKNGNYMVKLTVRDTVNRLGKCESSLQTYLKLTTKDLKEEVIATTAFALQKAPPKTVLQSKAWTYIILMLLLTAAGWSWLQWFMRPFLEQPPKDYFKATESKASKPLLELIQPTFLQFEIANLLRKRQASRRKEMALAKTLQATVEKGGYSELHYQFKSKPTEYLALVELADNTPDHIDLAKYLSDFFVKQDVLLQTFFYKNEFDKIWNPRFPDGISLRKLYELFPENRLLVFGDTNRLVANWQHTKQLPAAWMQLANQWQHQVVCTNTAIPDQLFASIPFDITLSFFSADLAGVSQAINYLEETTTAPVDQTATWVNQTKANKFVLTEFNEKQQTNFQSQHPEIYRWFLALTVYPSSSLSTIIAIGKSLKIAPTYDKLQALMPLANLQQTNSDSSLWLNNWEKLPVSDERLARQAVATELKNILAQPTTKDIDTTELKNSLVIQEFALNPHELAPQKKVRYLYQTGRLSDLQLTELDLIIQRHTTNYRSGEINGETFINFLNDALEKQQKVNIPWNIRYFWWAISLSLASLLLGSSMYFSKNERLKDSFKIAKSEAARLNNLAVDYYTEELAIPENQVTKPSELGFVFKGVNPISTTAGQFLGQAILVDSTFEKAHLNYQKLMYNDGLTHYQSYLDNNNYPLAKAKYPLTLVLKYPLFKDTVVYHSAMLTLANIHHLLNEQDSTCQLLSILEDLRDKELLSKIQQLKKQAVYCADEPVPVSINGQVIDKKTLKGLRNVSIKYNKQQVQSDENGFYQLQIIKTPNQANAAITYYHPNYQTATKNIEFTSDNLSLPIIQLKPSTTIRYTINGQIINGQTKNPLSNISISNTTSNQNGYFHYTYTGEKEIIINIDTKGYLPYQQVFALDKLPNPLVIELMPIASRIALSAFDFPVPPMIIVPSGTFTMGCTAEQEYVCQLDERPAHKVQLDSFEIGKYEITNEEFAAFLNDYGSTTIKSGTYAGKTIVKSNRQGVQLTDDGTWQAEDNYRTYPAIGIAHHGAVEYCTWLSKKTGQTWRLPTEAEWEYAARGGPKNVGYIFAGSNNLESVAWCYKNSFEKGSQHPNYGTNPVGQRKSNALGIHDMSGNVFEWINGWYQEDAYEQYSTKLAVNPTDARTGEKRMLRGGSWYLYSKDDARVSNRISVPENTQGNVNGFRVVRILE